MRSKLRVTRAVRAHRSPAGDSEPALDTAWDIDGGGRNPGLPPLCFPAFLSPTVVDSARDWASPTSRRDLGMRRTDRRDPSLAEPLRLAAPFRSRPDRSHHHVASPDDAHRVLGRAWCLEENSMGPHESAASGCSVPHARDLRPGARRDRLRDRQSELKPPSGSRACAPGPDGPLRRRPRGRSRG
jgi:hypothetical protein